MKWALIRNDEKTAIGVGFCNPIPLKLGTPVWVGSLSSRDGWTTTPIIELIDERNFKTMNSVYKIVPLEEYYDDKNRLNQS